MGAGNEAQSEETWCSTAELSVSAAETDSIPDSIKVEYTVTTGRLNNHDDGAKALRQDRSSFFYQWPVKSLK